MQKRDTSLPKVVVLLGPTGAGKTRWSLDLAAQFSGEIISADSRQVYKKMDIGTAKTVGTWRWNANWNGLRKSYYVGEIIHHLVDCVDPGKRFTAAQFRDQATKYVKLAYKNKRIPFLVGGTGLYITSIVDNLRIPRVAANSKLRDSLEEKTNEQLLQLLKTLDPLSAKVIDRQNKRRMIRALEVSIMTGEPFSQQRKKGEAMFRFLEVGIDVDRPTLYQRINDRVDTMIEQGLIKEIERLLRERYSWELPSMSGIGYRQFRSYFEKKISLEEAVYLLKRDTRRYARQQLSWFRRDERIIWCKTYDEVKKLVHDFLG